MGLDYLKKELKEYNMLLMSLNNCIELAEQIVKPLKEEGLCQATLKGFNNQVEIARKDFRETSEKILWLLLL